MENELKSRLFTIMEEGHHMFYPNKNTDYYQDFPGKNTREIIENIAFDFNGTVHYYKHVPFEIRITYRFNSHVENYLFRHVLWENFISYQTTGLPTTTYIELAL